MANKTRFTYEAILGWDETDQCYQITFPDFPEAYAEADTLEEAFLFASGELEVVVSDFIEADKPLPKPHYGAPIQEDQSRLIVTSSLDEEDIERMYYLSINETAEELNVTPARIYALIKQGTLAVKRFDKKMMVEIASINTYQATPRKAGRPRKDYFR